MKTKTIQMKSKMAAILAFSFVAGALWLSGEGRADALRDPVRVTPSADAVQDKRPDMELDLKIFVHRNGLVAARTPDGRLA